MVRARAVLICMVVVTTVTFAAIKFTESGHRAVRSTTANHPSNAPVPAAATENLPTQEASPTPTPTPTAQPSARSAAQPENAKKTPDATGTARTLLHPATVTISAPGFWSWSLMDRRTKAITGSNNQTTAQSTASMIKAWIAADYLRRATERGTKPSRTTLNQITIMIRDSDNDAASDLFAQLGQAASTQRLIAICGLTDSRANSNWSSTMLSARDAARMGQCIADGRAAGPTWTEWLLTEMRSVRGAGRFGIIDALPAAETGRTAIKNGWINRIDGRWHVNCLAIGTDWVLAVETVYPISAGQGLGALTCRRIATQLMA